MKIFNSEMLLRKKGYDRGIIENYPEYLKEKMLQLLMIAVIYFILFYGLGFLAKKLDKLNSITPPALQEKTITSAH